MVILMTLLVTAMEQVKEVKPSRLVMDSSEKV
jgi:hypothetical protein